MFKRMFGLILVFLIVNSSCVNNNNNKGESKSNDTKETVTKTTKIEWVDIPAGTYTMGPSYHDVEHQVTLTAFRMSKYEITVKQFKAFIDSTGYVTDAEKGNEIFKGSALWTGKRLETKEGINWRYNEKGTVRPETEYNYPVVHVTCNDAKAFAEWVGGRLPTEAEWEYACKAGTTTPFSTGNNITTSQANYNGDLPYKNNPKGENRGKILPVGNFPPNPWGLCDMHGNVSEWCSDWEGRYPKAPQTNPIGGNPCQRVVYRGGKFDSPATNLESSSRGFSAPNYPYYDLGFRIVSSK